MAVEAAEVDPAPLVVQAFTWGPPLVKLRVQPEEGAEVRRLLDDAEVPHSTGLEASAGPIVDLVVAVVEDPKAWAGLGTAITAYLTRNLGRSVQFGDIIIKGENAKDSMRMIRELQARRDAQPSPGPVVDDEDPPQS